MPTLPPCMLSEGDIDCRAAEEEDTEEEGRAAAAGPTLDSKGYAIRIKLD